MHTVATGAAVPGEQSAIEAFYKSHTGVKGMYAVDGGSTESLAKVMQKLGLKGKVHAGGFDLTEQTQNLIKAGYLEFTIDQQPYLQGFVPALQLFFYKVSGTQTGPFEAEHGPEVRDKETVDPYLTQVPLRGHDVRRPSSSSRKQGRERCVASVAQDPAPSSPGGAARARRTRAGPSGASVGSSASISLREGSIIVITIVVGDLLLGEHEQLLHRRQLRNAAAVLRAVRDPRGGRGVRDDPRRDRPVDRRRCTCSRRSSTTSWTPRSACRSGSSLIGRAARLRGGRRGQRLLRRGHRDQLVRGDAGDAVHLRGAVADHLQRHAGRDAGGQVPRRHVRKGVRRRAPTRS